MTDLQFATVRLKTGLQIHYAEQGDDDGEPVIFLHGWPDSWRFGDSERPHGGYGINEFAADVVAFLDAASIERTDIVGHSFGSFVSRLVAITHPERVGRMILVGTGASAANPVTREVQAAMVDLQDPVPMEFARNFQASTAYLPLPESFFERIVDESLKLPARLWRDVFNGLLAYEDAGLLARIVSPTLLIWGEKDALFPREDQAFLQHT